MKPGEQKEMLPEQDDKKGRQRAVRREEKGLDAEHGRSKGGGLILSPAPKDHGVIEPLPNRPSAPLRILHQLRRPGRPVSHPCHKRHHNLGRP